MAWPKCEALGWDSVPCLAEEGSNGSRSLRVLRTLKSAGSTLPPPLYHQLRHHKLPDVQFCTNVYDGSHLRSGGRTAGLNVLTQAYVFNDATRGQEKESRVELGVYLPDSIFSFFTVPSSDLPIGKDIDEMWTDVKLGFQNGQPACTPNNAKVTILTSLPGVLFYSLCRVHYEGKPVRSALTLHIILLDQTLPLAVYLQTWTLGGERDVNSGQVFASLWQQLSERIPGEAAFCEVVGAWMHPNPADELELYATFLKRVIWVSNGSPNVPDFGTEVLQEWSSKDPIVSLPWLSQMCRLACLDLIRWLSCYQPCSYL